MSRINIIMLYRRLYLQAGKHEYFDLGHLSEHMLKKKKITQLK